MLPILVRNNVLMNAYGFVCLSRVCAFKCNFDILKFKNCFLINADAFDKNLQC